MANSVHANLHHHVSDESGTAQEDVAVRQEEQRATDRYFWCSSFTDKKIMNLDTPSTMI